jgi:hypothetical protein
MKKINLKINKELKDDYIITISDGNSSIELTYSCLLSFKNIIETQGDKLAYEKYKA